VPVPVRLPPPVAFEFVAAAVRCSASSRIVVVVVVAAAEDLNVLAD